MSFLLWKLDHLRCSVRSDEVYTDVVIAVGILCGTIVLLSDLSLDFYGRRLVRDTYEIDRLTYMMFLPVQSNR